MSKPYTKKINGFKVKFDCSKKERKTLEDKLNLINLGNGKDLCLMTCDETGCKTAKLTVRPFDNVDKSKLKNGGIEIEGNYTGLTANNCSVYHDTGECALYLGFGERQLLVKVVFDLYADIQETKKHPKMGTGALNPALYGRKATEGKGDKR